MPLLGNRYDRLRVVLILALLLLFPGFLCLRPKETFAARPNVVVIQTDDQARGTLRAGYRQLDGRRVRVMPNVLDRIGARGVEFTRYYASNPVCAPSRAALLTGQYSHSSGFVRNAGPYGGWTGWQNLPLLSSNLAVDLQADGYRTTHIGKFTNNYIAPGEGDQPETTVPPGWDNWLTTTYGTSLLYYGYRLNANGAAAGPFGDGGYDLAGGTRDPLTCTRTVAVDPDYGAACNQSTDLFTRAAVSEIENADRPFYLQVDYHTPHGDNRTPAGPEPPTRYYDNAFGSRMHRMAGFNEADIRDKPRWLRNAAPTPMDSLEVRGIDTRWRKEVEALRGVDDGVGAILDALERTGRLKDTYVFYLSDNGYFHGEHRLSMAKFLAYEPSARLPMLVRGPGIRPGIRTGELTMNVDLAPTVLRLARGSTARVLDGRPMQKFWRYPNRRTWRPILLESSLRPEDSTGEEDEAGVSIAAPALNYRTIRTGQFKYTEYTSGERELYDLRRDPAELRNRVGWRSYRPVVRRLRYELHQRLQCSGAACRKPIAPLRGWKK